MRNAVRLIAMAALSVLLGACASTGDTVDDGVTRFTTQQRESPGDLYVALAAEYYRMGQMEAALERAQRALQIDNRNGRAHYLMALILQSIGEDTSAARHFEQAISLEPQNGDFRNAWGAFLCRQGRYAEADAQFTEALANPLFAAPAVTLTNAAVCAINSGDPTKGEGYLRQALAREPNFAPALLRMAEIEYQRGDHRTARGYLERLMQTGPVTPQALLLGVRVERALGNRQGAQTYAQYLRQAFPEAPENNELRSL
ncbi:type IV pilus biogenesis/stability protein PilW [Thioalkalicoccus limnaeus]|uniref:Type IV pilus biogenesis/stability protein PilW n=1 Tax=Thioalkalicoccus limnaeus TaxID=120681 RepID=A0ABV4BDB7_9GAMM